MTSRPERPDDNWRVKGLAKAGVVEAISVVGAIGIIGVIGIVGTMGITGVGVFKSTGFGVGELMMTGFIDAWPE